MQKTREGGSKEMKPPFLLSAVNVSRLDRACIFGKRPYIKRTEPFGGELETGRDVVYACKYLPAFLGDSVAPRALHVRRQAAARHAGFYNFLPIFLLWGVVLCVRISRFFFVFFRRGLIATLRRGSVAARYYVHNPYIRTWDYSAQGASDRGVNSARLEKKKRRKRTRRGKK